MRHMPLTRQLYRKVGPRTSCQRVVGTASSLSVGRRSISKRKRKRQLRHRRSAPSPAEVRERQIAGEVRAWERLEYAVARRERELAALREPMDGVNLSPQSYQRNEADQWEARYLAAHASETIPTSAYDCANAARYCASDPDTCDLGCAGCRSHSAVQTSTTTRCSTSHAARPGQRARSSWAHLTTP